MNKETEQLLRDLVVELEFRSMRREQKDRAIKRIKMQIENQGYISRLIRIVEGWK